MAHEKSFADRWSDFKPSKTMWFWSMAGAAVATIVVGFTVGGWTTGGSAQEMAEDSARDARAQLASALCVEKFVASASAASTLAELKEASGYQQDDFIEDGGWVTLAGLEEPVPGAADLCAEELVAMESLPAGGMTASAPSNDS